MNRFEGITDRIVASRDILLQKLGSSEQYSKFQAAQEKLTNHLLGALGVVRAETVNSQTVWDIVRHADDNCVDRKGLLEGYMTTVNVCYGALTVPEEPTCEIIEMTPKDYRDWMLSEIVRRNNAGTITEAMALLEDTYWDFRNDPQYSYNSEFRLDCEINYFLSQKRPYLWDAKMKGRGLIPD